MASVRKHVTPYHAGRILHDAEYAIQHILTIPPGDMRLEQWDPAFRQASRRLARIYSSRSATPVDRLAAVAGILYQVRCNLFHGSKDPSDARDLMLILESTRVLSVLVPAVEAGSAEFT